ncbi:hypothetical protein FJY63_08985, partial [Candidatus Sumerlaeota bacterium]|nr:hypothetical protein [Candidatus Sumerlaeota bacterium]
MSGLADLDLLLPFESRGAELAVAQSDLCPAIVIRARSRRLRLFADMPAWGLGGPTFAAIPTEDGIEILSSANCNSIFACPDILRQSEPWLLCWFEGAEGWDRLVYGQPCHWRGHHPERPFPHIDVPWLIVLQRRPERIEFGSNGLDLVFKGEAGAIVAMPLYGADLLAVEKTRLWREGLPADVTDRCRTWSRRLRRIPIGCRETFSMDEKDDTVVVRQDFDYLAIEDDWATEGEYISPYPPFAALAERWGFPIVFEQPPTVGEVSTLYGPYSFARDAQSATYRIRGMLRYVREDETYPDAPRTAAAGRAVARLRLALADDARLAIKTSGGYTRGLALALTSYARALRYLADEQKPSILEVMSELLGRLLDPTNYMPFIRYSTAEGNPVGEAICQRSRDAYKVVQANLFGLWAATATLGQWEQIVQAWPLIRRWFHLPFQTQWLTALPARWEGLDIARALFDGTAGYARLAAAVGATDDYRFACYLFAKVCAGWFATEMMPRYHREHQPWLFNTDADYLIWHPCRLNGYVLIANDHLLRDEEPEVDGRGWASAFGRISPTCARFWRDHLRDRADEVLNQTLRRCRPDWAQSGAPAVVRSCVLGESPEQMEHHRAADEAAEQAAASHPLRLRTYHLFQSTPIVKEIAMAEAGATPERAAVLAETSPMEKPSEGASQTADRVEQAAMPVRTASLVPLPLAGGELSTGEPPALRPLPPTLGEGKGERNDLSAHLQSAVLLYWPGVRTPKKPFAVLDERLDLFPFGSIQLPDDAISAETSHAGMSHEERHPNWCLTISTFHGPAIEPIHI